MLHAGGESRHVGRRLTHSGSGVRACTFGDERGSHRRADGTGALLGQVRAELERIYSGIEVGPWVGIITGLIAGTHRYLIDIGGVTALPCFITSILAGCIAGWINRKIPKAQHWRAGILGGKFGAGTRYGHIHLRDMEMFAGGLHRLCLGIDG